MEQRFENAINELDWNTVFAILEDHPDLANENLLKTALYDNDDIETLRQVLPFSDKELLSYDTISDLKLSDEMLRVLFDEEFLDLKYELVSLAGYDDPDGYNQIAKIYGYPEFAARIDFPSFLVENRILSYEDLLHNNGTDAFEEAITYSSVRPTIDNYFDAIRFAPDSSSRAPGPLRAILQRYPPNKKLLQDLYREADDEEEYSEAFREQLYEELAKVGPRE